MQQSKLVSLCVLKAESTRTSWLPGPQDPQQGKPGGRDLGRSTRLVNQEDHTDLAGVSTSLSIRAALKAKVQRWALIWTACARSAIRFYQGVLVHEKARI